MLGLAPQILESRHLFKYPFHCIENMPHHDSLNQPAPKPKVTTLTTNTWNTN